MNSIPLHVATVTGVGLHVKDDSRSMSVGGSFYAIGSPYYEGAYEITPSESAQTIPIQDYRAAHDILVNPIPSNYGLITWNGSYLMVS